MATQRCVLATNSGYENSQRLVESEERVGTGVVEERKRKQQKVSVFRDAEEVVFVEDLTRAGNALNEDWSRDVRVISSPDSRRLQGEKERSGNAA